MAKIALFGGSFDPPHFAHIGCIKALLASKLVEQVWIVPSALHRDKSLHSAGDARLLMLEMVMQHEFANYPQVKLELRQLGQPERISTTMELLEEVEKEFPQDDFWIVIGSDLLTHLSSWHRSEELKMRAKFIVIPRPGFQLQGHSEFDLTHLDLQASQMSDLSSRSVRAQVNATKSVSGLCPIYISSFIQQHGLYRS